jgi:hypothetical protein
VKRTIASLVAILAALSLMGTSVVVAQDAESSEEAPAEGAGFTVVPPGGNPLGVPYEEWAANWWKWMMSVPLEENPGEVDNCQANQAGEVFIIPLTPAGNTLETSCTIGADKYILVSGGSTINNIRGSGGDEERLRADIEADLDADPPIFSNVSVTVDGEAVPDIDSYRVISPLFDVDFIEDNLMGQVPGTTGQQMIGGWFVMLEPLSTGDHTIVAHDDIQGLPTELIANVEVTAAAEGGD